MPTTSESQRPTRDTTQPITTIAECVSRLQVSRSWHGNKVGEAEFERDAKAHAEKYDLKRHAPSASKNNVSTGPTQVVVQNVATFKDVVFLRDVGSGAVHSVVTEDMKDEMIRRGFEVVYVTHHTDATTLSSSPSHFLISSVIFFVRCSFACSNSRRVPDIKFSFFLMFDPLLDRPTTPSVLESSVSRQWYM